MYPDFQYLFQSLTGTAAPGWLSLFKVFGFFVALAFLSGTYVLYLELKRKEKEGLIGPVIETKIIGKPSSIVDYLIAGIIGFVLGYKVGGLFTNTAVASADPLSYILSLQGNFLLGLLGAALSLFLKYRDNKKNVLSTPQEKKFLVYPHQRISEIIMIAALGGLGGAKLFNAFETWDDFIRDPIGNLISSSGLTFYGGLILATLLLWRFARKYKIGFAHLCDAAAPALLLAYGVGRLGCHFSGDGDWGIFNSAYVTQADASLIPAQAEKFQDKLAEFQPYFENNFGAPDFVPYKHVVAPSGMPTWMYGMNYAHNVNNEGIAIPGCTGSYCAVLPVSVFPTSLYEFAASILLMLILWSFRKKLKWPLHTFGVYLIFNGLERFFIEKIRVNYKYDWGFLQPTQAEIISTLLVLCGIAILIFYKKKTAPLPSQPPEV